jgi:hypothetical protein
MNNIWIYTIAFYVKKNDGISLREFMSFPFHSYEDAINFRKEYEKRENINKMFSKDYHWESILEEKEIK